MISFYNRSDRNHKNARNIVKALEGESILWVISDYIFDEFLTVLMVRMNKRFAAKVGETILDDPNIKLVKIDEDVFRQAWHVFCKNEKRAWSFTDSTSYILIKKLAIVEAVSFDKHFGEFGIKILK